MSSCKSDDCLEGEKKHLQECQSLLNMVKSTKKENNKIYGLACRAREVRNSQSKENNTNWNISLMVVRVVMKGCDKPG